MPARFYGRKQYHFAKSKTLQVKIKLLYIVRVLLSVMISVSMRRVSWKADGMRYMMLIDREDEIYFFDRDHNIFKVEGLRFVHRKDIRRHLKDTLLDGVCARIFLSF